MSDGFRILEGLIRFTGMRHGVITSNIANADTPHYKARDLAFDEALGEATLEVQRTNVRHISYGPHTPSRGEIVEAGEPWADGNTVELDLEVGKMTENALLFQTGVSMFSTKIRMFKSALRRQ